MELNNENFLKKKKKKKKKVLYMDPEALTIYAASLYFSEDLESFIQVKHPNLKEAL